MNLYMFLLGFDRYGNSTVRILEELRFHAHGMLVGTDASGRIYAAGSTGYERQDGYFMPPVSTDVFLMEFGPDGSELLRTVFSQPLENSPRYMELTDSGQVVLLVKSSMEDGSSPEGPEYSILLYSP
jgi:hypothetical protein